MTDIKNLTEHLDRILSEYVQHEPLPGLAIGIIKDSQMIYAKGFGVRNIVTNEPVDNHTLFHQASISKTLVATGIMQLVELGSIQLDSTITDYLHYFTMADKRYRLITIRQLLNHTSGMPDEDDYEWDRPQFDELSLETYVRGIHNRELLSEPGAQFAYSNIAYEILGDIIAKVSGVSFEQYMQDHIFEPLQMRGSSYLKLEADSHLATPHILGAGNGYGGMISDIFPYNRAHGPSSTLYASAEDMCKYAIAQLSRGTSVSGQSILQSGSYDKLWKPYKSSVDGAELADVGLSWFLGEYNGYRMVSHSGMDTGFQSNLILLPDQGIAVSVMINSDYVWPASVCNSILDILLGADIPHIKRSLAHHLSKFTINNGVDSALEEYHRIQSNELERYYNWESEFTFIANMLTENGFPTEAMKLVELSTQLFHRSSL
jgi:CubicO group peptidase (beta-lactamase class C family)